MNIKDIAMKVAKQMRESVYPNPYISEAAAIDFAEALVAELAKENEPVGWFKFDKVSKCWHPQYEQYAETHAKSENWKQLYLLPPTAGQIEQETATEWQPIETAPKDGTDIIVMYMHIDTQIVHNAFWNDYEDAEEHEIGWWSYDHSEVSRIKLDDWMTPTHWMPLPTPPKRSMEGV